MSGQGCAGQGSTFSTATHLSSTCRASEQFDISLVSHSFPGGGKDSDMGHFLLTGTLGCCLRVQWWKHPSCAVGGDVHGLQNSWELLAALFSPFFLCVCLVSVTQLLKPAQRNEGCPELQPEGCSQSCLAFSISHISSNRNG